MVPSERHSAPVNGRVPFVAIGVTQLVAAALLGYRWVFLGVGVAMCTDSGSTAFCTHLLRLWLGTGLALALNVAAGITMLATAGRPTRARSRRVAGMLCAASALFLGVVGLDFLTAVSGPIH